MSKFIYTMKGLGKVHQPDHVVLKDIWLSFLPGAKIGVLGLNGSGKSSLLRIMAGEDHSFRRRSVSGRRHQCRIPAPGAATRSCQERSRQRRGRCLRDSRAPQSLRRDQRQVWRRDVGRRDGQGPRRAGQGAGSDRGRERMGPRLAPRARDGRAAPAAAGCRREHAVGRRAASRGALPAVAALARPPAPRRAHQPPRRRISRVAGALPQGLCRDGRRRHPRSLLPRQCCRLDPGARSRLRHPVGR